MRLYIGLTYTKAQVAGGNPAAVYVGPSRSAAKLAASTPVDGATASKGTLVSNLSPENRPVRRNPAGT